MTSLSAAVSYLVKTDLYIVGEPHFGMNGSIIVKLPLNKYRCNTAPALCFLHTHKHRGYHWKGRRLVAHLWLYLCWGHQLSFWWPEWVTATYVRKKQTGRITTASSGDLRLASLSELGLRIHCKCIIKESSTYFLNACFSKEYQQSSANLKACSYLHFK